MIKALFRSRLEPVQDIELTIIHPSSAENNVEQIAIPAFKLHPLEESVDADLSLLSPVQTKHSSVEVPAKEEKQSVAVRFKRIFHSISFNPWKKLQQAPILNAPLKPSESVQLYPLKNLKYQLGEFGNLNLSFKELKAPDNLLNMENILKSSIVLDSEEKSLFSEVTLYNITRPCCKVEVIDPELLTYYLKQIDPEFRLPLQHGPVWMKEKDLYILIEFLKTGYSCSKGAQKAIDSFLSHT